MAKLAIPPTLNQVRVGKAAAWAALRDDIRFVLCGRWGLDQYGSSADLEETIDEILDAVLCSGVFR